ncbi:unnamed protein product [Penicillium camemberti]|uniref:Str. FM013 n=1 Tax=Penicillium camemberti (strain FM 013) TaxID=1429867 RepID=A0A0G4PDK5_PENC3|nr:unnamed protein product [Penicillium camemberti]
MGFDTVSKGNRYMEAYCGPDLRVWSCRAQCLDK